MIKQKQATVGERIGATAGDVFGNVLKGVTSTGEGIVDAGMSLVGLIGGIFDKDFKDEMGERIAYDWTTNTFNDLGLGEAEKISYLNDFKYNQTVREIAQGVGFMLPTIAVSFIPGVGPTLGQITMGVAAGGKGMEEALNTGAGYESSMLYGALSGVSEALIEKLGGFVIGGGTSVLGKRLAGTTLGKITSTGLGKVAEVAISEAGEEIASSYLDPILKGITGVDTNVGENLLEAVKNTGKTAVVGATVGSILHGGQVVVTNTVNSANHRGGSKATKADNILAYISEISQNYGDNSAQNARYDRAVAQGLVDISNELQQMKPEDRKNYLNSIGVYKNAFDTETGKIKPNLAREGINTEAVSSSIRNFTGAFTHVPIGSGEAVSEGARLTKNYIEKILGADANVIISNMDAGTNAAYNANENVFYINNNSTNLSYEETVKQVSKQIMLHEITHFTEGTKFYDSLEETLLNIAKDENAPAYIKQKIGDIQKRMEALERDYESDLESMNEVQQAYTLTTERNADLVADLLSDDYFINKLAEKNQSFIEKLINKINVIAKRSATIDSESAKYLKDLVKKFENAISHSQGGFKVSSLGTSDEEKEKTDANSQQDSKVDNERKSISSSNNDSVFQIEFEKTVDAILNNTYNSENVVIIGRTPEVLTDIGLSQLPLSITANHIYSIVKTEQEAIAESRYRRNTNYHGLGIQAIKQIREKLSEPIMVIAHQEFTPPQQARHVQSKKIVVIVDLQVNGKQAICPIEVNTEVLKNSKMYDVNFVDTYFEKGNVGDLIKEAVAKENIGEIGFYYIDKKKAANLLQGPGYQLPQHLASRLTASNTIIRKIDANVNRKISDFTQSQQFIRFFGDWQNNPKKASKAVNEDGTPKVLYHQTEADFNVFSISVEGAGTRDNEMPNGIFLKSSPLDIGLKGKKQTKVYVNIRNPLVFTDRSEASRYWKQNVDGYKTIIDEIESNNVKYQKKFDEAYALDDEAREDAILDGWENANTILDKKAKTLINEYLKNNKHDGIILKTDEGNFGTKVQTYVVLDSTQIKSATDNIGTFDSSNSDIRYSKKRSYNPTEDANFEEWLGNEYDEPTIIFSTPDISDPRYEANSDPEYLESERSDEITYQLSREYRTVEAENAALKKFIADYIKLTKYLSKDAKSIFNEIINEKGYFDNLDVKFKGKSRAEIERRLWDALNTKAPGQRGAAALDIAYAMLINMVVTEKYVMTPEVELAYQLVNYLKTHLHNINLDNIKGDIRVKYDKNNSPYAMWARKEGTRGVTADQIKDELMAEIPGIKIDAINEADIFLEIDELYRTAKKVISDSLPSKSTVVGLFGQERVKTLRQEIAKDILRAWDTHGTETKFSILEKRYVERLGKISDELYEVQLNNKLENRILKLIQKIRDHKEGKYANATQTQTEALQGIKALLSKLNSREQINRTSTRDIMKAFSEWYKENNPVLENFYSQEMYEIIQYFSKEQETKKLSYGELQIIEKVLQHMNHVFENYGKIFRRGKYVDAKEIATAQNQIMLEALDNQPGIEKFFLRNKITRFFMDPIAVAAQYDGHDPEGFFTTTLEEFQEALVMQRYSEMEVLKELYNFTEKAHKKYFKDLLKGERKIKVGISLDIRNLEAEAIEVPVHVAMDLYMVSKTGNAMETLSETGWLLRLDGEETDIKMKGLTKEDIKRIYNQFSEEDKQLIEIMESAYNGICRDLKYKTDITRLGVSNVFDGYYYPIRRITSSKFDSNDFFAEMERVSNVSINKNRVKGAKQALIVGNAIDKFVYHVNAVTRYAHLSIPISNMEIVFNMDVADNANMPDSIKTKALTNKMWDGAEDYIHKLADDMQQVGIKPDEGSKVFSYLRGAYSKVALGANPKVWFTQLSSYIASFGELSFTSLIRATTIKGFIKDSEVDKYCKLAAVRHYERGATKAMTVTDKIGTVGNVLTAPIEFVDRQVVKMLFAACQVEVKSKYNLEIGSEENKVKAGELLTKVILRCQQNQLVTEQSKAMRSSSELTKSFVMFNADSMKLISRFIEYIGKTAALKNKMKKAKANGDETRYKELNSQYKQAKKSLIKYSVAIIAVSAFMALITRLFNWLYNKDKDDEDTWSNFGADVVGNIVGMVPIVRDVYTYLEDGYEPENYAYSMFSDILKAINGTKDAFSDAFSGKDVSSEKWASNIRNMVYSVSQFLGIPTRNLYNFVTGITRRIDEGTGLSIDAFFYEQSDSSLKKKYIEAKDKNNTSLMKASLDLMYKNRDMNIEDNVLRKEMDRLLEKNLNKESTDKTNYSPLGSKMPETATINGEEVELTSEAKSTFKTALKQAETSSAYIVKTVMYKKLNDESKAYAIRTIYSYYHNTALETLSGEREKLVYFGNVIGIDKLALILAYAKFLPRENRKEKIIAYIKSLGLDAVKSSLALRYFGYSDKDNDNRVQSYIQSLRGLTFDQKQTFSKYL